MGNVDFCDDSITPSIVARPCAAWNVDTSVVDWHTLLMLVQQPAATWSKQMIRHMMTAIPSITMAVATHVLLKLGTGAQSWVPAAARHEANYVATSSVLVVKPLFAFDITNIVMLESGVQLFAKCHSIRCVGSIGTFWTL